MRRSARRAFGKFGTSISPRLRASTEVGVSGVPGARSTALGRGAPDRCPTEARVHDQEYSNAISNNSARGSGVAVDPTGEGDRGNTRRRAAHVVLCRRECRLPRAQRANGAERTRRVPRESARARAGEGGRVPPAGGGGPRRPSIAGKPAGPRHRPGHLIHVRGREPRAWHVTHSRDGSAALRRASHFTLRRPVYSCRVPPERDCAGAARIARGVTACVAPAVPGLSGSARVSLDTIHHPNTQLVQCTCVHPDYTFVRAPPRMT